MTIKYQPLKAKSALHKVNGNFPFNWDLNVYRGCGHGCVYCYALYSHDYLKPNEDFFGNIYVKENLAEVLDKEFWKKSWKGEMVNLGEVTDSYQPLEKSIEMMPDILRVFIKHRNPLTISTKSDLILRDIDLYAELAALTTVNISVTITTPNESIRKKIEPFGAKTHNRFKVLNEFKKIQVSTGLHLMPIIPYLTDDYNDLDYLFQQAAKSHVDYLLTGKLYLRGKTRPRVIDFMRNYYPELFHAFSNLYTHGEVNQQYVKRLYENINFLRRKYSVNSTYKQPTIETFGQQSLF